MIGPHFQRGVSRIGRERLPNGIVAILNNDGLLRSAIAEMHEFVQEGNRLASGRAGVVFRTVNAGERDALNWHMQRIMEDVNATCGNLEGFRHILDIDHIAHICNRHGDPDVEKKHGHIAIALRDFLLTPEVVQPQNLTTFQAHANGNRFVYSREYRTGRLILVQEIRTNSKELVVKTLYKQK